MADLRGDVDDPDFEYLIVDSTSSEPTSTLPGPRSLRSGDRPFARRPEIPRSPLVVRGAGCPVRFILAKKNRKGRCTQAAALLEVPAEVVVANTAYDADRLRQAIAARRAPPSSPTTHHGRSNIGSTSISMPSAISWSAASQNSYIPPRCNPLRKDSSKYLAVPSLSPVSYGCDKCPHLTPVQSLSEGPTPPHEAGRR